MTGVRTDGDRHILLAQADAPHAETGGTVTETVEHADDGHGTPAETYAIPLEIWLLVALIILFLMIYRPMKRSVLGALDARAQRIRDDLDEAQRLREDAQSALASVERQQRDALRDAEEIIAHARQEAERLRAQASADLDAGLKRREQLAMDRIAQAEAAALAEVRGLAVDVAASATRAVLAGSVDEARGNALIDQSIRDLDNRLH